MADPNLDPPALSEQELKASMRKNILAGASGSAWLVATYGLPLPLFMDVIHATGFQLGLMGAVRQAAMFAQLPSALFVERLDRRKPFWATVALIHRGLWLVPALLPVLWPHGGAWWVLTMIFMLGISDSLGNASTAPWSSWMADLLPPARAGRFWGVRQRILSSIILLAALAYGLILDSTDRAGHGLLGFTIVFCLAAIFGMGDILIHLGVAEPAPLRSAHGQSILRRIAVPFYHRGFRRFTLALGVWTAALALPGYYAGTPGFFNVVYLHESFGATYTEASWLILASASGSIFWSPKVGHGIDRFGARRVAMFLAAIGPLFALSWFFVSPGRVTLPLLGAIPQSVLLMCIASVMIGGAFAGMQLCQYRLTQALTPNVGRTVAMGVHWSSVGLIGALGALTGGWIKDHFPASWNSLQVPGGASFSYFHVIILLQVFLAWGVAIPLLNSIRRDDEQPPR